MADSRNTLAKDDVSGDLKKSKGGSRVKVSQSTHLLLPPTVEAENLDTCLPAKVMKLIGVPEAYGNSFLSGIVEDVQEIISLPSKTASTIYDVIRWVYGKNEAPPSEIDTAADFEEVIKDSKPSRDSIILGRRGSSIKTPFKLSSFTELAAGKRSDDSLCIRLPPLLSFSPSRYNFAREEITSVYQCELLRDDLLEPKCKDVDYMGDKLTSEKRVTFAGSEGEAVDLSGQSLPTGMEVVKKVEGTEVNENRASPPQDGLQEQANLKDGHSEVLVISEKIPLPESKGEPEVTAQQLQPEVVAAVEVKEKDSNQNDVPAPKSQTCLGDIKEQNTLVNNDNDSEGRFENYVEETDSCGSSGIETGTDFSVTESEGSTTEQDPIDDALVCELDYCQYCKRSDPTTGPRRQASFLGQIYKSKTALYPAQQPPKTAPSLTFQDRQKFRPPVYIPKRPQSQPRNNLCRKIKMLEQRNHELLSFTDVPYRNGGDHDNHKKNHNYRQLEMGGAKSQHQIQLSVTTRHGGDYNGNKKNHNYRQLEMGARGQQRIPVADLTTRYGGEHNKRHHHHRQFEVEERSHGLYRRPQWQY